MLWQRKGSSGEATPRLEPHVFQEVVVPAASLPLNGGQCGGIYPPPVGGRKAARCVLCQRLDTDPIHRHEEPESSRWGL